MFDHIDFWRRLNYQERLVASIVFLELYLAPGTDYIDSDLVARYTCLKPKTFTKACESLFGKDILDVDESFSKLCLKGELKKLFDEEMLKRRKQ